jgi:hypothetical protein
MRRGAGAIAVAAAAFCLYRATLLPGFDFGDTGSFQTAVGAAVIRVRDAYPLYFALGQVFLWITRGGPAYALNLASAVQAAAACGLILLVAQELSGSLLAARRPPWCSAAPARSGVRRSLPKSHALHIAFVAGTLLLLLRWQRQPTLARLSAFFAVYALGFGNHLSMILLAPVRGFSPGGGATAGARCSRHAWSPWLFAALGAAQYLWNLVCSLGPQPPHGMADAFGRRFDVTRPLGATSWS